MEALTLTLTLALTLTLTLTLALALALTDPGTDPGTDPDPDPDPGPVLSYVSGGAGGGPPDVLVQLRGDSRVRLSSGNKWTTGLMVTRLAGGSRGGDHRPHGDPPGRWE